MKNALGQSSKTSQLKDVENEIERWESLLSEEHTRWESFSKAAAAYSSSPHVGGRSREASSALKGVRFEQDSIAAADGARASADGDIEIGGEGSSYSSEREGIGDVSINEQLSTTVEQLIEKNMKLAEELDWQRNKSAEEISFLEETALREKTRADGATENLVNLRGYVADYLDVPSEEGQRTAEEQHFWEEIATTSLLDKSRVPGWWGGGDGQAESGLSAKVVLPIFPGEKMLTILPNERGWLCKRGIKLQFPMRSFFVASPV